MLVENPGIGHLPGRGLEQLQLFGAGREGLLAEEHALQVVPAFLRELEQVREAEVRDSHNYLLSLFVQMSETPQE